MFEEKIDDTSGPFNRAIRGPFMFRWLSEDPEVAQDWFSKGEIEGVHWYEENQNLFQPKSTGSSPKAKIVRRRYYLGEAAGLWLLRDPESAVAWMKKYPNYRHYRFASEIMKSIDDSDFLRAALASLSKQEDRDGLALTLEKVIFDLDDHKFWVGGPRTVDKVMAKMTPQVKILKLSAKLEPLYLKSLRKRVAEKLAK